jgi:3'-phosphoadenosine 5'-phosphosulfate sulfotransferase (PAPS reductase)/FAD synthetase
MNSTLENSLFFVDAIAKIKSVLSDYKDKKWRVAYSGGSDSDTTMWILRYAGFEPKAVFHNTGLEYEATWKQIEYMRSEGFDIEVIKAKIPIPTSNRVYGHPFISKQVSEMLQRLQKHDFDFQNHGILSFDELYKIYPNCKSALRWWTNNTPSPQTDIQNNRYLKEFLIEFGLPFRVANKCCDGAKKLPIKQYVKEHDIDLMILGIRKSERGKRNVVYKNCYVSFSTRSYSMFFPIFWINDEQKRILDLELSIKHSDCYEVYGLKRTGCAGCPFGRNFEQELAIISHFEPKLNKGINSIFASSYEWTRKYKEYVRVKKTGKIPLF